MKSPAGAAFAPKDDNAAASPNADSLLVPYPMRKWKWKKGKKKKSKSKYFPSTFAVVGNVSTSELLRSCCFFFFSPFAFSVKYSTATTETIHCYTDTRRDTRGTVQDDRRTISVTTTSTIHRDDAQGRHKRGTRVRQTRRNEQ